MSLFELLNEVEKEAMKDYIEVYATSGHKTLNAPLEYIMRHWNAEKEKLYHLLGDNLIISKDISFVEGEGEIQNKINDECFNYDSEDQLRQQSYAFTKEWYEKFLYDIKSRYKNKFSKDDFEKLYDARFKLSDLLSLDVLTTNIYDDETFVIPNPQDITKPIKVMKGAKASKMIGKIAKAYSIPHFEEFRLKHSQALNQKTLHGKLCLSIHPLDYMTMSDNDSGWSSCMSWKNNGCYRQGTVEMMNSPMVIVAYLAAKEPMKLIEDKDYLWSNKKWRELFIVNENIISEVKAYPYDNHNITDECLNWLRELANKYYGYEKYTDKIYTFDLGESNYSYKDVKVDPHTEIMYNDFSSNHHIIYSKDIEEKSVYSFSYSGESECMICGASGEDFDWDTEEDLMDLDCSEIVRCDACDDKIYNNDPSYEVDGFILCSWCYTWKTKVDSITGEVHLKDNMRHIFIKYENSKYETDKTKYFYNIPIYISSDDFVDMLFKRSKYIHGTLHRHDFSCVCGNEDSIYFIEANQITKEFAKLLLMNNEALVGFNDLTTALETFKERSDFSIDYNLDF